MKTFTFVNVLLFLLSSHQTSLGQNTPAAIDYEFSKNVNYRTLDKTKGVGSLGGSLEVGPSGNATYTIPLDVPSGLGAAIPAISIHYNSSGGNSTMGYGWSISAHSAITRTGSSNYYKSYGYANPDDDEYNDAVDFDEHDRFAFNGQRLQNINRGPTDPYYNPSKGSECWETFLANYARITSYGKVSGTQYSPDYFVVISKDNIKTTFGESRISAQSKIQSATHNNEVLAWLVSEVEDPNGNTMSYEYAYDADYNHTRLTQITYGNNIHISSSSQITVHFEYGMRSDIHYTWIDGERFEEPYLITAVEMRVNGQKYHRYEFAYTDQNQRSQLVEVLYKNFSQSQTTPSEINSTLVSYGHAGSIAPEVTMSHSLKGKLYPIDLNGDGFTDFISERYTKKYSGKCVLQAQTQNTYEHLYEVYAYINNQNNTYQEILVKPQFISQIKVGCCNDRRGFLRIKTGDFNADGKGDFMITRVTKEIDKDEECDLFNTSITVSPAFTCEFYSFESVSQTFTQPISNFDISWGNYDRWLNSSAALFPEVFIADFNADGYADLLWDKKYTTHKLAWELILGSQGLTDWNAAPNSDKLRVDLVSTQDSLLLGDFTGDGQVDIFSGSGNGNYVIYSYGKPQGLHNLYVAQSGTFEGVIAGIADFNADGKADIATLDIDIKIYGSHTSNLRVYESTGQTLKENPRLKTQMNVFNTSKNNLWFYDVNSDGYSDVIQLSRDYTMFGGVYFPIQARALQLNPITQSFDPISLSYTKVKDRDNYVLADTDADGHLDLWDRSATTDKIISFYPTGENYLLKKISDGLGRITTVDYGVLTEDPTSDLYSQNGTYSYPIVSVNAPFKVVSSIHSPDGIGGTTTTNYSYKDLLFSFEKGLLGFGELQTHNMTTSIKSITEYSLISQEFLLPSRTRVMEDVLMSEQLIQYVFEGRLNTNGGLYGWRHYSPVTTEINHLNQTSKQIVIGSGESGTGIDDWGNLETSTTYWFNNTTATGSWVRKEVANYTYSPIGIYGSNGGLNKVTRVINTSTRAGETDYVRQAETEYYPSGNTKKETFDPGSSMEYSINYEYSHAGGSTGFLTKESASAPGLTPRQTIYTYSSDYRFVEQTTNSLGHTSSKHFAPLSSELLWEEDANGLRTTYTYDGLGKLIRTDYPDGTIDQQGVDWTPSGTGIPLSLFYSWVKPHSKGYSHNYKDMWGREIRSETETFSGVISCIVTEYNNKGEKYRVSEPFNKIIGATHWTTYSYRTDGRPDNIQSPNAQLNYSYNGRETTITNQQTGQQSSKVMDAAGAIETSTDQGGTLSYTYYSHGKVKEITTLSGTVTMQYDLHTNKTQIVDPDAGTISYIYNAFDELLETTDAEGNTDSFVYDVLGRTTQKTSLEGVTRWEFDNNWLGAVSMVQGPNGIRYDYSYDALGRMESQQKQILGERYTFQYGYNAEGQISQITYPGGLIVHQLYDTFGNMVKINTSGVIEKEGIWTLSEMDAKARILQETHGNRLMTTYGYDVSDYGYLNNWQVGSVINYSYDWEEATGNLLSRQDVNRGLSESFTYDDMDRLLSATVAGQSPVTLNYTPNWDGSIETKSDVGEYIYNAQRPHVLDMLVSPVNPQIKTQNVTFNSFKKAADISEGDHRTEFIYGPEKQRKQARFFVQSALSATRTYVNSLFEEDRDAEGNITLQRNYIYASGRAVAVITQDPGSVRDYYLHNDYLGSVLAVTDGSGAAALEQNFDAWGNHRDIDTWQKVKNLEYKPQNSEIIGERGYTFHEHLPEFAMINMNGRIYDPVLCRFISPDPHVQAPTNTQNFDRYAYAFNNPLKYTDPSGEVIHPIIVGAIYGAAMGASSYTVSALMTNSWDLGEFGMSVLGGAVSGALLGWFSPVAVPSLSLTSVANAVAGGAIGSITPGYSFTVGEWSFSISPSLMIGNSMGAGVNLAAGYSKKNGFQFSMGTGFTFYGTPQGSNRNSGWEGRFAFKVGYIGSDFGIVMGSNFFYNGAGSEFNQQMGLLEIHSGDFMASYENDGFPFSDWYLADGGDKYRTAAASVRYKNFGIGFNLFTGTPIDPMKPNDSPPRENREGYPFGLYTAPGAEDHRLGAVYLMVGNFRFGTDSEAHRHAIQNKFAHGETRIGSWVLKQGQPWFKVMDIPTTNYIQYHNNSFTLW